MKKRKKVLIVPVIAAVLILLTAILRICCGYIPCRLSKDEKQQVAELLRDDEQQYYKSYDGYFDNNCFVSGAVYSISRKIGDRDNIIISLAYTANEYIRYKEKCYSVSCGVNYINLTVKLGDSPEIIDIERCEEGMNYNDSIFSMYMKISPVTYFNCFRKSWTVESIDSEPSGIFDRTCDEQAEEYFGVPVSEYHFDYDHETDMVRVWDWDDDLQKSVTVFEEKCEL